MVVRRARGHQRLVRATGGGAYGTLETALDDDETVANVAGGATDDACMEYRLGRLSSVAVRRRGEGA